MNSDNPIHLPPLDSQRKTGNEPLQSEGMAMGPTLLDFWQWSTSNLVDNTLRGTYAEWLVANALECADGARREWGSYNILSPEGIRVEVKSAAFLQSWAQERLSTITFSIRRAHGWDPATNSWTDHQERDSDVYVFCLLAEKDKQAVDPLNLDQWQFYVAPTSLLDLRLGEQKTLGLSTLADLGLKRLPYSGVAAAVRSAAAGTGAMRPDDRQAQ